MRSILVLLAALLLATPLAAAGPGSATACNALGTGACVAGALTPTLLSCVDAGGVRTCQVEWEMRLDITGTTCGWGWAAEMGEVLTCNAVFPSTWVVAWTTRSYTVPAGGSTVTSDALVCVDYSTPLQRCEAFQASIDLPGA